MIARSGVLKFETSKECQRAVAFAHTVEMGRKVAIISNTRSSDFSQEEPLSNWPRNRREQVKEEKGKKDRKEKKGNRRKKRKRRKVLG